MNIQEFKKCPIVGILRGVREEAIKPLVEAAVEGGLKALEITMNTDGAFELIKKMKKAANGRLFVGAGTVLTMHDLKNALDAGATFIVSPVLVEEVVAYCVKHTIPVFPGALTPQEIYKAWEAGATMVKVFPAKFFGPSYMKEIKGPLEKIELLACGGVDKNNIKDFIENGASAVAFGGSIFNKEWIKNKEFDKVRQEICDLVAAI